VRISRRGFLAAAGAATVGGAIAGGRLGVAEQAERTLGRWATPEEKLVPSICQQCPGGCGLLVRTMDGHAVGLKGNPHHPVNRGGLCPKAFGGLQLLHSAHRYRGPLIRDGARGRFRPVGWDEALALLGRRLADLRAQGLAHTVAILGGQQYRGYRDALWRRFAESYGTPNYIRARCTAPERAAAAHRLTQGVSAPLAYDLADASYILAFGVGLLESWWSPVHASLAFARLRERPHGKLVVVDPHRSLTAGVADRWIPIRPGTDGVLALSIAHILIREGLYDRAFVGAHAAGFEEFKALVLGEYDPEKTAPVTGVTAGTVVKVAREMAATRPALVVGERGPSFGPRDVDVRIAIHTLNALLGSIGAPGGVTGSGELPLPKPSPVKLDGTTSTALRHARLDGAGKGDHRLLSDVPQAIPGRVISGTPYPVNLLFLFATNPVGHHPAGAEWRRAFERIPMIVSFSPFPDESSALADLILPDHMFLERWQDDWVTHLGGFACFSLTPPATPPLHQTRNTADVVLRLAKAVGGTVAESLPWESFERVLLEGARAVHEADRGFVAGPKVDQAIAKIQRGEGEWAREFDDFEDFRDALLARGAWWDPVKPASPTALLRTRSGKFEFHTDRLAGLARQAGSGAGGEFPLLLNTYRLVTRPVGGARQQGWLLERPAVHVRVAWENWVEIHPTTARALGVRDGDLVWVASAKGRIKLRAKLFSGTRPEVVHIPLPLDRQEGADPNALIADEPDPGKGFGLFNTTRVRIRSA